MKGFRLYTKLSAITLGMGGIVLVVVMALNFMSFHNELERVAQENQMTSSRSSGTSWLPRGVPSPSRGTGS